MSEKVIDFNEVKARAAGVSAELATVIEQLNERFGVRIELSDERLQRFKTLFPALNEAARQQHSFLFEPVNEVSQDIFEQGVEVGRAQMMTDVIVCILEQDGLLARDQ